MGDLLRSHDLWGKLIYRQVHPILLPTQNGQSGVTAVTFFVFVFVFAIVYPIANSGIVGGGSDRDEALNIAATELVHGRYPYYPRTYLGNPILPLPGSVLLAVPFVLLGNSAYQNFFWLSSFFITERLYFKDGRLALLLLWIIFALSPAALHELVTGGDSLSNTLYIF